ncbi:MAG TPA: cupin domain-containing protein [Chloroflexota bacterium]|nr:cupin domain-containing protein [Chloroflexota bacterium]
MTIPVFDYRTDIANVVVHPEIRARFMRMEPGPAAPMHSHDLGGEIFLVLEGQCEFIVENEPVTCGPGQLIYIEPRVKHTLHAVGDGPCVVYLSVAPHVEPTHTRYDDDDEPLPPRYASWRGKGFHDPNADRSWADLAQSYATSAHELAARAQDNADAVARHLAALEDDAAASPASVKPTIDALWLRVRDALQAASELERTWNELAPRGMPADS